MSSPVFRLDSGAFSQPPSATLEDATSAVLNWDGSDDEVAEAITLCSRARIPITIHTSEGRTIQMVWLEQEEGWDVSLS